MNGNALTRRATPPYVALLAKSLLVCVVGGAFFGAAAYVVLEGVRVSGTVDMNTDSAVRLFSDGIAILVIATIWAFVITVPFGIPAGFAAAGIIWWLRSSRWQPTTRTLWTLLGGGVGLALSVAVAATIAGLVGSPTDVRVLAIPAVAGLACGTLLAWLVSPEILRERRGRITKS